MARLALFSRNPAMAMGLASTDHSLIEVRPSTLDEWLDAREDIGVDAIILDIGSTSKVSMVVGDLRAERRWTPVLIVDSDVGVSSADLTSLPNVVLLPLPIDPARLKSAVEDVLCLPRTMPMGPVAMEPPQIVADVDPSPLLEEVPDLDPGDVPELLAEEPMPPARLASSPSEISAALEPTHPGSLEDEAPTPLQAQEWEHAPAPDPDPEVLSDPVVATEPEVPTEPEVSTEPDGSPGPATQPDREPTFAAVPSEPSVRRAPRPRPEDSHRVTDHVTDHVTDRALAAGPGLRLDPSEPPLVTSSAIDTVPVATAMPTPTTPEAAVADLLPVADALYTLGETASVIVDDAVARGSADSGVLLVPDGELWRVAAGAGIRPLEHRLQLAPDSWLIQSVAAAGKGVLIQDSDVVRQNLHGAPLASRPHLLAVPVPTVGAVLLLARDRDEPFTEQTLATVADLAQESAPLLRSALELRALARGLARHLDPAD